MLSNTCPRENPCPALWVRNRRKYSPRNRSAVILAAANRDQRAYTARSPSAGYSLW